MEMIGTTFDTRLLLRMCSQRLTSQCGRKTMPKAELPACMAKNIQASPTLAQPSFAAAEHDFSIAELLLTDKKIFGRLFFFVCNDAKGS